MEFNQMRTIKINDFFMEVNDTKNNNEQSSQPVDGRHENPSSGMEANNKPEANKQEHYVKDDQQSDLSYGRNSGRESDGDA